MKKKVIKEIRLRLVESGVPLETTIAHNPVNNLNRAKKMYKRGGWELVAVYIRRMLSKEKIDFNGTKKKQES